MITFVTPCSPSHVPRLDAAVASVEAQTTPCQHIVVMDHDRRGPGVARNLGLLHVTTPFVVFLDADDTVAPTFAEETLLAWRGRYVYTDWMEGDVLHPAPACAWVTEARPAHLITALVPTVWALEVGGFDIDLPGGEDTDFYLRLIAAGHCGRRLARPLFQYGAGGERSRRFVNSPDFEAWKTQIFERYSINMACCGQGDESNMNPVPSNDEFVLAIVTDRAPGGTQRRRGLATGLVYEDRIGIGETLYVHPLDIDHPSGHFARVDPPPMPPMPTSDDFEAMANALKEASPRMLPPKDSPTSPPTDIASRVSRVIDLWGAPKFESAAIPEPEALVDAEAHGAPIDPPPVVHPDLTPSPEQKRVRSRKVTK